MNNNTDAIPCSTDIFSNVIQEKISVFNLKETVDFQQVAIERLKGKLNDVKQQNIELESENKSLTEKLKQLQDEINNCRQTNQVLTDQVGEFQKQEKVLLDNINKYQTRETTLMNQFGQLQNIVNLEEPQYVENIVNCESDTGTHLNKSIGVDTDIPNDAGNNNEFSVPAEINNNITNDESNRQVESKENEYNGQSISTQTNLDEQVNVLNQTLISTQLELNKANKQLTELDNLYQPLQKQFTEQENKLIKESLQNLVWTRLVHLLNEDQKKLSQDDSNFHNLSMLVQYLNPLNNLFQTELKSYTNSCSVKMEKSSSLVNSNPTNNNNIHNVIKMHKNVVDVSNRIWLNFKNYLQEVENCK